MDMTELYEFAKQFDVIVIFILLYGFAVGSIVYWITDFLHWCWTKFKKTQGEKTTRRQNSRRNKAMRTGRQEQHSCRLFLWR